MADKEVTVAVPEERVDVAGDVYCTVEVRFVERRHRNAGMRVFPRELLVIEDDVVGQALHHDPLDTARAAH